MIWIVTKFALTSALIVLISEVAKRSDRIGGLIAALPVMTFLTLIWLYVEKQPDSKIANHAYYTFWYVLPTLPMFALFPFLLGRLGFWGAMGASVVISVACFALASLILKNFGIRLL